MFVHDCMTHKALAHCDNKPSYTYVYGSRIICDLRIHCIRVFLFAIYLYFRNILLGLHAMVAHRTHMLNNSSKFHVCARLPFHASSMGISDMLSIFSHCSVEGFVYC